MVTFLGETCVINGPMVIIDGWWMVVADAGSCGKVIDQAGVFADLFKQIINFSTYLSTINQFNSKSNHKFIYVLFIDTFMLS